MTTFKGPKKDPRDNRGALNKSLIKEMTKKFSFGKLLQLHLFLEMIIQMACQDVAQFKEELT